MLNITGYTEDGKKVVGGLFELFDTKGLPLTVSLALCQSKDMVPSIPAFVDSAIKAGWKNKTILSRMQEAYQDSYGDKFWQECKPRIEFYLKHSHPPEEKIKITF